MNSKTELYSPPECVCLNALSAGLMCTSPEAGGLEGVEYEDWVTKD